MKQNTREIVVAFGGWAYTLCEQRATISREGWRRVSEVHEQHTDPSALYSGYDNPSCFGPIGSPPSLYVFDGPTGENSLNLSLEPPSYHHCGTGGAGWLSGWAGSAEC